MLLISALVVLLVLLAWSGYRSGYWKRVASRGHNELRTRDREHVRIRTAFLGLQRELVADAERVLTVAKGEFACATRRRRGLILAMGRRVEEMHILEARVAAAVAEDGEESQAVGWMLRVLEHRRWLKRAVAVKIPNAEANFDRVLRRIRQAKGSLDRASDGLPEVTMEVDMSRARALYDELVVVVAMGTVAYPATLEIAIRGAEESFRSARKSAERGFAGQVDPRVFERDESHLLDRAERAYRRLVGDSVSPATGSPASVS